MLTNRCPTGLNRGFGGPQLYMALERTMAIAAGRLGLDPAELARRNLVAADEFPYRTPSGGLYDSGDYEGCLDDALELVGYDGAARGAARGARGRAASTGSASPACVEPSISNMGYITLAQTAEERAGRPAQVGQRRGRDGRDLPARRHHRPGRDDAAGPGARDGRARRSSRTRSASRPRRSRCVTAVDTSTSAWTVSSGNYSSRFSGVGAGAVHLAAQKLAAKIAAIRDHLGDESLSLRRVAGIAHWNPEALPPGMEPGLHETAFCAAPNLAAAGRGRPRRRPRPPTGSSSTSPSSRSTARPAR